MYVFRIFVIYANQCRTSLIYIHFKPKFPFHGSEISLFIAGRNQHWCICISPADMEHIGEAAEMFPVRLYKVQNASLNFSDSLLIGIILYEDKLYIRKPVRDRQAAGNLRIR